MTLRQVVERVASARSKSRAEAILAAAAGRRGLSRAYFEQVARLAGTDPQAAEVLAGRWRLFLAAGDDESFVYRARAVGEKIRGRYVASARSFRMAGLKAKDPVARLSYQAGAVDSLARAGRIGEAVRLGARLARGLDALGEAALAGRVKLNVGNALLWADRYDEAKVWLAEATKNLVGRRFSVERGAALLGLSTAELFGGDPRQGAEYARQAASRFRSLGMGHFVDLCRLNEGYAALLSGRADQALKMFLQLRERFKGSPVERARSCEFAGDAYLRLNLWDEAEDSFRTALSEPAHRAAALNKANCWYGIGLAQLAAGMPRAAIRAVRKARDCYHKVGNRAWEAAAMAAEAKAMLVLGRRREALALGRAATRMAKRARSPYHIVEAGLTVCEALVANQKPRNLVIEREVAGLIRKHGYVSQQWRVHYIDALRASGAEALREYRRMFQAIVEARALTSSVVSQAAFLRDKTRAIGAYVGELLKSPTEKSVREALSVVERSRSIALLDEVATARKRVLNADVRKRLDEMREEIARIEEGLVPGSSARGVVSAFPSLTRLQRLWVEAVRLVESNFRGTALPKAAAADVTVLVEANGLFYALRGGQRVELAINADELDELCKWLYFELLEPAAGKPVFGQGPIRSLCDLREKLLDPWWRESAGVLYLSPDSGLWRVPWQALTNLQGVPVEPVLLPTPRFGASSGGHTLPARPKAAVWAYDGGTLPNVEAEVSAFLTVFPRAAVLRTASEVLDALDGCILDVLHVACHARLHPSNPMFSYLELGGGRVRAADIAQSRLQARLVTLSACETGTMSLLSRHEPDGLARSFLARGAKAVAASMWALDDEAASTTMHAYYNELAKGRTVVLALAAARARTRVAKPHPYYWAPIVLFGGYSGVDKRK